MSKRKSEDAAVAADEEMAELREQLRLHARAINKLLRARGDEELVPEDSSGTSEAPA